VSAAKVLVVGAGKVGGLGDYVVSAVNSLYVHDRSADERWEVVKADKDSYLSEVIDLDLAYAKTSELLALLEGEQPTHIVCTVGINKQRGDYPSEASWYNGHFMANCVGPMRLLEAWLTVLPSRTVDTPTPMPHFAAISSNSAHIARTGSAAYCASKAALSMAIRCKARENKMSQCLIYAYEPGLLRDTPMTEEVRRRLPGQPLSRMPGLEGGIWAWEVALAIGRGLGGLGVPRWLNGCTVRMDAGEQ
jgi:NAD(P)-dependent dehydrogenase (short-subunit alcohol dehydrogenase family)